MKELNVEIIAHMYTINSNLTKSDLANSGYVANDFDMLLSSIHFNLKEVLHVKSNLFHKSLEQINIIEGTYESVYIPEKDLTLNISIRVSDIIEFEPEIDPFRDKMKKIDKDIMWLPSSIQVNNVYTKGNEFNSFWTADLFIEELFCKIKSIPTDRLDERLLVKNALFTFDKDKFEEYKCSVVY